MDASGAASPAAHVLQETEGWLFWFWYLPAVQGSQSADVETHSVPALQLLHTTVAWSFWSWYLPWLQGTQPPTEKSLWSASHAVYVTVPLYPAAQVAPVGLKLSMARVPEKAARL